MNTKLKVSEISKIYPGCIANDKVSLEFGSGKIYALLGENGAGKSTLVKILSGVVKPDEGEVFLNDESIKLNSPLDAKKNNIGMVFQHFNLFETLSVFENLSIDSYKKDEDLRVLVNDILKKYNFKIDLDIPVLNLSAGQKQKVEIIRCLIRNPKVLIMDEPTSVLTEQETDDLFISLKQFSKDGILIIYITHKLKEVLSLCDEVAVMRKGKVVSVSNTIDEKIESLANKMVGENLNTIKKKINNFKKKISVSGDKSISIRWVLFASIASGISIAKNLLVSEDVMAAINIIKKFGIKVVRKKSFFMIFGKGIDGYNYKKKHSYKCGKFSNFRQINSWFSNQLY